MKVDLPVPTLLRLQRAYHPCLGTASAIDDMVVAIVDQHLDAVERADRLLHLTNTTPLQPPAISRT